MKTPRARPRPETSGRGRLTLGDSRLEGSAVPRPTQVLRETAPVSLDRRLSDRQPLGGAMSDSAQRSPAASFLRVSARGMCRAASILTIVFSLTPDTTAKPV